MVLTYFCPWTLNLHIAIVLLHLRVHYSVEIKRYKSQIRIRIAVAELCESEFTLFEVKKAIKELAINKTPGPDGLPNKLYKISFEDLSDLLYKCYALSFQKQIAA